MQLFVINIKFVVLIFFSTDAMEQNRREQMFALQIDPP